MLISNTTMKHGSSGGGSGGGGGSASYLACKVFSIFLLSAIDDNVEQRVREERYIINILKDITPLP